MKLFLTFDFALDDFADERGPALPAYQSIDALTKAFRQANDCRFHSERWPSHTGSVSGR